MEWKKVLEFEHDDKDFRDRPIVLRVVCKWRSDGVMFYAIRTIYPDDPVRTEKNVFFNQAKWDYLLNSSTDVEPCTEKDFDDTFLFNMKVRNGRIVDTGYSFGKTE